MTSVIHASSQKTFQNLSHTLFALQMCCHVCVELSPTFSDGISGPLLQILSRVPHRSAVAGCES